MRPLLSAFALAIGLSACADGEPVPSEQGDRADEGFDIIDINLGESLSGLSVERLPVAVEQATKAEIGRSTVSLRLHLQAGESASIVMRGEDLELDPYLLVKDLSTGETTSKCDDQVFVAHAGPQDAVVSLHADQDRDYLIVAAGGADMHTAGRFTIDSIAHSNPHVDFAATGPGLEAITKHLRTREAAVDEWILAGALEEGDAGFLVVVDGALTSIPLSQRAEFNAVVRSVNGDRGTLFDEMVRRSGDAEASRESVGEAVASIYQVTR
jgi:hypothetical protein